MAVTNIMVKFALPLSIAMADQTVFTGRGFRHFFLGGGDWGKFAFEKIVYCPSLRKGFRLVKVEPCNDLIIQENILLLFLI